MGLKQRTSPFRFKSLRRTTSQILKSLSHPGKRATPTPVLMPEMRQMKNITNDLTSAHAVVVKA